MPFLDKIVYGKRLRANLASRSPWKPAALVLARPLPLDHIDPNNEN